MIVGNTEIDMYAWCRWRWDAMSFNRHGLTPITKKPYLDLGTLVHQTDYDWIMNPAAHPADLFDEHAKNLIVRVAMTYKQAVGANLSKEEFGSLNEIVRIGKGMMENYGNYYGTPLPPNWSLVSAEQTCLVPIPNTRHKCDSSDVTQMRPVCTCIRCEHKYSILCEQNNGCVCCCWHQFEGTVDALISDEHGRLWIKETKTWDKHPNKRNFPTTPQFARYMWLAEQLGIPAMGIAYNGLWTRAMPPRGSKMEDCFIREQVTMSDVFIERMGNEIASIVNEMASDPVLYKNRNFFCNSCGVYSLCQAHDLDEDFEYVLQSEYTKRPLTVAFEA